MNKNARLRIKRNRTFGILTDFFDCYPQELRMGTRVMPRDPLPICPDPEGHIARRGKGPVCLACPTCWSSLRVPGTPRKHNTRTHKRLKKHYLGFAVASKRGSVPKMSKPNRSPSIAVSPALIVRKEEEFSPIATQQVHDTSDDYINTIEITPTIPPVSPVVIKPEPVTPRPNEEDAMEVSEIKTSVTEHITSTIAVASTTTTTTSTTPSTTTTATSTTTKPSTKPVETSKFRRSIIQTRRQSINSGRQSTVTPCCSSDRKLQNIKSKSSVSRSKGVVKKVHLTRAVGKKLAKNEAGTSAALMTSLTTTGARRTQLMTLRRHPKPSRRG